VVARVDTESAKGLAHYEAELHVETLEFKVN
jgi:hypothetical protein